MYKILVVDDEDYLVDGVTTLLRETEGPELDVYSAYTAFEALDWLERTKIDVVLSDIHMPGMDGLELQRRIAERWPDCKVIFLTGYDDFEYAKTALQRQAVDYILKTEGDAAIVGAVRKAIESIDNDQRLEELVREAEHQRRALRPVLQREFWLDLLAYGAAGGARDLAEPFAELGIGLSPDEPVLLLLGEIDRWSEGLSRGDKALILYAAANISEEIVGRGANVHVCTYDRNKLVWFVQPDRRTAFATDREEEVWGRLAKFIQGSMETVQTTFRKLLRHTLSVVVAREAVPWKDAAEKYESLKLLFNRGLGTREELLLSEDVKVTGEADAGAAMPTGWRTKLGELSDRLSGGQRDDYFAQYYPFMENAGRSATFRLAAFYGVADRLLDCLERNRLLERAANELDLVRITSYERHDSWAEATSQLASAAEWSFAAREETKLRQEEQLVLRLEQHIRAHLSEDLSLVRLGELVALNPVYLSRVYKQLTGRNLTDTIMEAKLERAKELLGKTDKLIQDITKEVGFESPAYFTRFFKKYVNLSPQQYRDSLR